MLKQRPKVAYASTQKTTATNQYGIQAATKGEWLALGRDYVENFCDHLYDIEQIEALTKFVDDKDYNCDITISTCLCIVHAQDEKKIFAKAKEIEKINYGGYLLSNGKIINGAP